jgi:hypothetical protein
MRKENEQSDVMKDISIMKSDLVPVCKIDGNKRISKKVKVKNSKNGKKENLEK